MLRALCRSYGDGDGVEGGGQRGAGLYKPFVTAMMLRKDEPDRVHRVELG